jgi:hypothetical protein
MSKTKPTNLKKSIANAIKRSDTSYFFEDYNSQATAVLKMLQTEGFMIVPNAPTEDMIAAGVQAIGSGKIRPEDHVRYVYNDMIKQVR